MSLTWNQNFSVGSELLDSQHKKILILIDELEAVLADKDKKTSKVKSLLNNLTNYASEHFETEEGILKSISYVNLESHKAEHDRYVEYVAVELALALHDESKLEELQRFLKQWWAEHILVEDKEYKAYLELSM